MRRDGEMGTTQDEGREDRVMRRYQTPGRGRQQRNTMFTERGRTTMSYDKDSCNSKSSKVETEGESKSVLIVLKLKEVAGY